MCDDEFDVPLEFFEEDVISPTLFADIEERTKTFRLDLIPPEKRIIGDEWFEDCATADKENGEENSVQGSATAGSVDGSGSRFGPATTSTALVAYSKVFVPKNTESNTSWAVRNFMDWCDWRRKTAEEPVPENLLEAKEPEALNKWLSLYLIETRRKDGKKFPSRTLECILSGLYRHARCLNPSAVNFLSEQDTRFAGLRGVRDRIARERRAEGIGASVKHSEVISRDEEARLWTLGLLGTDTPQRLSNAVFFNNGKVLCLRGGREHYNLKLSQFQFGSSEVDGVVRECVVYTENGSKNRSGSYKDKTPNKVVRHFAEPELGDRCYVSLLKKYFSVLPQKVLSNPDSLFYLQPKEQKPVLEGVPWFKNQVRGRNTLQTMVKQVCEKAGIQGKTNHSLRVTGATRMYESHVPEKLIKERTGHRSLDALRTYERASLSQLQAVSSVITSTERTNFQASSSTECMEVSASKQQCSTEQQNSTLPMPVYFKSCENCTINVTVHK